MDTKDTAETTAPSVASTKLAPKRKPAGEPEPEDPVPSVPLSGLEVDSLESLGAAFSELHVRTPEGKAKVCDQVRPWSEPIVGSPRVNLDQMVKQGIPIQSVLMGLLPPLHIWNQISQFFISRIQNLNL